MVNLNSFTVSIEQSPNIDPTMERWLDGVKDLQYNISEKVFFLCRYFEKIPPNSLSIYANLLIEALDNDLYKNEFLNSKSLSEKIYKFSEFLEKNGQKEKADIIREKVKLQM